MSVKRSVLIIDDHPVVCAGLAMTLAGSGEFALAGEAANVAEAREMMAQLKPDLVILDLLLGGRDGVELIEDLLAENPAAGILVYSGQKEEIYAHRAFKAGALGYLEKSERPEAVRDALRSVARGERVMSDSVRSVLVELSLGGRQSASLAILSNREIQILRLFSEGYGLGQIAQELHLSVKTIGTYRDRLKSKLGVENAADLRRKARSFLEGGS